MRAQFPSQSRAPRSLSIGRWQWWWPTVCCCRFSTTTWRHSNAHKVEYLRAHLIVKDREGAIVTRVARRARSGAGSCEHARVPSIRSLRLWEHGEPLVRRLHKSTSTPHQPALWAQAMHTARESLGSASPSLRILNEVFKVDYFTISAARSLARSSTFTNLALKLPIREERMNSQLAQSSTTKRCQSFANLNLSSLIQRELVQVGKFDSLGSNWRRNSDIPIAPRFLVIVHLS